MKKVFLIVLGIILISAFSFNKIQALELADLTPALDKKVAKMKTTEEKVKWLQKYSEALATPRYTQSKDAKLYEKLRGYTLNMLTVFQYELKEEQSKNSSKKQKKNTNATAKTTDSQKTTSQGNVQSIANLPHLSDNFSNIDVEKVREAVLSRHNNERKSVGVNAYLYNLDLEGSATVRANQLSKSSKTSNLHLRKTGDGYYNYNSILNRFSELGIKFPSSVKGAASFSESVGYGSYKCSKLDCTEDLIKAIKKTRTGLIMKEKTSNGSHYRAVTMKHFTQMGVGIVIDKSHNRYYIVIHYGVKF